MKIAIVTVGSRGDTQPFIALALGLQQAGHQVRLAAPSNFASMVTSWGLDFTPVAWDAEAALNQGVMKQTIQSGKLKALLQGHARQLLRQIHTAATDAAWTISEGADLLIFKAAIPAGGSIAELRGIPAIEANIVPWLPSAELPPLALLGSARRYGPLLNRLGGQLRHLFLWQILRLSANDFRRAHGLTSFSRWGLPAAHRPPRLPQMIAISPTVLPLPSDWNEGVWMTGYWFLPAGQNWQPPPGLTAFLERGDPPICIGFGSMTNTDPAGTLRLILDAVQQAGVRAVLIGGWGGLGAQGGLPDTVFALDQAPHDWLYPRCVAAVHHGGAGTTAAALRAGIPAVIVPHNFDQPFWGDQVQRIGAGTEPLPFHQLTTTGLAERLRQVQQDKAIQQRAQEIGRCLRAEDGIGQAIRLIERRVHMWQPQEYLMSTMSMHTDNNGRS